MKEKLKNRLITNFSIIFFLIIFAVLVFQNLQPSKIYSGWDNIHVEFNLAQYFDRTFFGAWQNHKGMGGPAAKGHVAEVIRLPYFVLSGFILPENLERISFIYLMYLTGGLGMYFYVKYILQIFKPTNYDQWVGLLASVFYLLHIITIQQVYISLELFLVQFAFFPILLLAIHRLVTNLNAKNLLFFSIVQLLIAPSAHTQTVFHLGVVMSVIYTFFISLHLHHKFKKVLQYTCLVVGLTVLIHSFWLAPHIYYTINNSHYVVESRANQLFGPESLWSIREASTPHSFVTGIHYLFSWKDYNFSLSSHEFLFSEWQEHLRQPQIVMLMTLLFAISLIGLLLILIQKKYRFFGFAIVIPYVLGATFIWLDLFPTTRLYELIYLSDTLLEAFRNPFTKMSVLYSIFLIILFALGVSRLTTVIQDKFSNQIAKFTNLFILGGLFIAVVIVSAPAFNGGLINQKLQIEYPPEYAQLFTFMRTLDSNARVLEMPTFSHEPWVYYDWQHFQVGSGYQGMGFYSFGIPQPFITPDFARWSESGDFFYHQLIFILNSKNSENFRKLMEKFNIPLIILDETRLNPYKDYTPDLDHQFLVEAGYKKIWQNEFLHVYLQDFGLGNDVISLSDEVNYIKKVNGRVREDVYLNNLGSYVIVEEDDPRIRFFYPFANLYSERLENIHYPRDNTLEIVVPLIPKNYRIILSGINPEVHLTTLAVQVNETEVSLNFPQYYLDTGRSVMRLKELENISFDKTLLDGVNQFFLNGELIELPEREVAYYELEIYPDTDLIVSNLLNDEIYSYSPDWDDLTEQTELIISPTDRLKLMGVFPFYRPDLLKRPSENCGHPSPRGTISTEKSDNGIFFFADQYGVNCNSFDTRFMSPALTYLLNIQGENFKGRGIKLFVNNSILNSLHAEYLFPRSKYNETLVILESTTSPDEFLYVNWETRSFGRESLDKVSRIQAVPIPVSRIANILLEDMDYSVQKESLKKAEIINVDKFKGFFYRIDFNCESLCYIGINQAFDDLWWGIDLNERKLLNHYRFNNWANVWEVDKGQGRMIIVYLPQLFVLLGASILSIYLLILIYFVIRKAKQKSKMAYRTNKKQRVRQKIKRKLVGK